MVEVEGELVCRRMNQLCSTGTSAERHLSSVFRKSSNKTCIVWLKYRKKTSREPLSNASKIYSGLLSAILDSATCSMFLLEGNSVLYLLDGCPQHRQNGIIEFAPNIMYTKFINEYD